MTSSIGASAKRVLDVLAELSPSTEGSHPGTSIPVEWFRWLELPAVALFGSAIATPELLPTYPDEMFAAEIDAHFGERLAAVDQVRLAQRSLRAGWLFVAGKVVQSNGKSKHVFTPLVTVPVRVDRSMFKTRLVPAGDVELTSLIEDPDLRKDLEDSIELGGGAFTGQHTTEIPGRLLDRLQRLKHFAQSTARAAGFDTRAVVSAAGGPDSLAKRDDLVIVAGVAVFALHDTGGMSRAATLRSWDLERLEDWTAFHSLYVSDWEMPASEDEDSPKRIESPYPLSSSQCSAVVRSRNEPVVVVAGSAGTGKSHTVAAIGLDAVALGQSVLVTARSDAAIDALIDLFERAPGPAPVVFGSAERREHLAGELAGGRVQPVLHTRVEKAAHELKRAVEARDQVRDDITELLTVEMLLDDESGAVAEARREAPGIFGADVDVVTMNQLRAELVVGGTTFLGRRRRSRTRRQLEEQFGISADMDAGKVISLLSLARSDQMARDQAMDGISISLWKELAERDDGVRLLVAEWLALDARDNRRFDRRALRAVAALATALRSGRAARRAQLAKLDDRELTRALPLWVGTLPDVDDLLPPVAGLFDLVIFDESSSIEQPLAASALLRARRAVIVGDSRQLRHVSFLADERINAVVGTLDDDEPALRAMLDVRRNSLFDAAAGTTTTSNLDEHFRCSPHLMDFVLEEFYGGGVDVATRTPATQDHRCSEAIRLSGVRDESEVVVTEVARVIKELRRLSQGGHRSVGVVTPFRAQADALEAAVLDEFRADVLEAMDLRVGTAHAFQGNERDVMIVSLGIGETDGPASWRHVEDPHLLTVLLTRARDHLMLIYSADPPAGGLIARYLDQVDAPAMPPRPVTIHDPWTTRLFDDLSFAGAPVVKGYRSGRHVVDLCLGDGRKFFGVETRVHPDGPDAHIDRHLDLVRAGWKLRDAFPSRWGQRPAELVIELMQAIEVPPGSPG